MKPYLSILLVIVAFAVMICAPLIVLHASNFVKDVVANFKDKTKIGGVFHRQAGLVTLLRAYGGYSQGQTVGFNASTEAALIASGQATNGTTVTPGNLTTNQQNGVAAIPAGQISVTITNPLITLQSRVWACVSQAAADATLLRIDRVVTVNGAVTFYGNANATAQVQVDWGIGFSNSLSNPS